MGETSMPAEKVTLVLDCTIARDQTVVCFWRGGQRGKCQGMGQSHALRFALEGHKLEARRRDAAGMQQSRRCWSHSCHPEPLIAKSPGFQ